MGEVGEGAEGRRGGVEWGSESSHLFPRIKMQRYVQTPRHRARALLQVFAVGKKDVGSVRVRVVKQIFILRVCFPALQVFRGK